MACLIKKKISGKTYYYSGTPKRINGKPKVVNLRYLGTAESIIQRLQNPPLPEPLEVDSLDFGAVASLWAQAKELDLISLIDQVIPQNSNREISVGTFLTVGAINRAIHPESKDGIGPWMSKTVLPRLIGQKASSFDSQSFWDAMDLVKEEHILGIEERVWERVLNLYQVFTDILFYDTTNFATHIDSLTACKIPQRGKPKKGGREQRLVGFALAATKILGLPFLHKVYEGNCHDARLFPEAMSLLVERYSKLSTKAKDLTVVFDKGNNSDHNIQSLRAYGSEKGIRVFCIGSLKPSHYPKLLRIPLDRFDEEVGEYKVYRTTKKVFGQKRTVIVTFHQGLYERQLSTLQGRIDKVRSEMEEKFAHEESRERYRHQEKVLLREYRRILKEKRLGNLLRVKIEGEGNRKLSLEVDKRAFKKKERAFGKTIIFCDHEDWTSEEIINAYRGKNVNEENFKFLKDRTYLHFDPLYHWTDQKIRVHALMCVLGLLLVKLLLYRAKKADLDISLPVMLQELNDIEEIIWLYPDNRIKKKIKRLSTVQGRLFDLFGLSAYEDSS
ncbi:MAG: IS1634 family transposase [Thermodesulfobacteriota bacterium]